MKRIERCKQILKSERKNITHKECCLILAKFRVLSRKIKKYKIKIFFKKVKSCRSISVNFNHAKMYYYPIY